MSYLWNHKRCIQETMQTKGLRRHALPWLWKPTGSAQNPYPTNLLYSIAQLCCFFLSSHFCAFLVFCFYHAHFPVSILAAFPPAPLWDHLKHHLLPGGCLHPPRWTFHAPHQYSAVFFCPGLLAVCYTVGPLKSDRLLIITVEPTTLQDCTRNTDAYQKPLLGSLAQDNIRPVQNSIKQMPYSSQSTPSWDGKSMDQGVTWHYFQRKGLRIIFSVNLLKVSI